MASKANLNEVGLTGLVTVGTGQVKEEFLPELQGAAGIKVYKEMKDNDPTVGSILFSIDQSVRQVNWSVEASTHPDAKGRADDDADFLRSCMSDLSHTWPDFVSEVMTMVPFGFSVHEIVYKMRQGKGGKTPSNFDDGKIGWRKFATRSQDSIDHWLFDDSDGGIKAVVQKPPPDYRERTIPIDKLLLFRTSTIKGNPEGRSALRNAYRPWWYKKRIEEIEAIGIERDLAGLPVAYVDASILRSDASDNDKQVLAAIQNIVRNIRQDKEAGIIWPVVHDANGNKLYDLQLMSSGGSRNFDTSAILQRYDKSIAMTVLADFVMLGSTSTGSFALASSKTNLFAQALGAWLKVIEGVLNTYAVPRLFEVNGMDATLLPQIRHGDIETPELNELGAYLGQLAGTGMPLFPNAKLEETLLQAARLPLPTPEEKDQQDAGAGDASAMGQFDQPADMGSGDIVSAIDQLAQ
jgi:hypothetical protein